jgi:hypothetical protein
VKLETSKVMAALADAPLVESHDGEVKVRGFPRFDAEPVGVASAAAMARYLVELYWPNSGAEPLQGAADRLAESARRLSGEGNPVCYLDTIFLPTDETCLHLFEAASEADVRAAAEKAGIDVDRVVPAEQIEPCDTSSTTSDRKEGS